MVYGQFAHTPSTNIQVDVKFIERLDHPPTLALIKLLAASSKLPPEVEHIGESGLQAIKGMQLVNRGRLSTFIPVQRISL